MSLRSKSQNGKKPESAGAVLASLPSPAPVQYVHLVSTSKSSSGESNRGDSTHRAGITSTTLRHTAASLDGILGVAAVSVDTTADDLDVSPRRLKESSVFEGRDCDNDDEHVPSSVDRGAKRIGSDEVLAISDVVDFFDTITRVGACRYPQHNIH